MQTTNLPLQLNTAINGSGATQRSSGPNAAGDAGQFSAMLSSQLALPQASVPQAPAAPKQDAPKPAQVSQPAQADDTPAPQQASSTQDAVKAGDAAGKAKASDTTDDDKTADSDDTAPKNADPANAMLALIASLQQPAAKPAAAPAKNLAQAFDALSGNAGKAKRSDAT